MADEPQPSQVRSRLAFSAMLLGLVTVAAIFGVVLSVFQRPAVKPQSAPSGAPAPLPTFGTSPTPVAHGPVSAFGFSVADDPPIHRVLLFGGVGSDGETWLWDGSRWSRAAPHRSPPGRFQAAAAYDPDTRMVMLFGGRLAAGQIVDDTWGWSGSTWRQLDNGADSRPPGEGALMAWDAATREMVLVTTSSGATGGETWVWTGTRWSRRTGGVSPPTPIAAEMAFDPASDALLFVSALLPPMGVGTTTWRFDGRGWHSLPATPPAATAGLALDPMSGRLLLCSDATADASAQLWRWSGGGWMVVPQSALSIHEGIEVTDNDRGQFLMLGFDAPPAQTGPQPVLVWEWSGRDWHVLT
jgi:hypothetical protein